MTETLHLQWGWDWSPRDPGSLNVNTDLVTDTGGIFGGGVSFGVSLDQLPDGVQGSLAAITKRGKEQLETANPTLDVALPEGAHASGIIELTQFRRQRGTEFVVSGKVRYSSSVEQNLNALTWSISDLPDDLSQMVTALDAPIHDFALEKILSRFDGAPELSEIPSALPWVFVSYHKDDEEFAGRLATRLERTGAFHAFYFPWEISWGESNRAAIDGGLARCGAGIVVFTPEFFSDTGTGWRDYEYGGLINKMVNGGAKVGYALLRGEHANVPVAMQDHFYADFRDLELFEEEFVKVLRGLLGRPLEDRPIL